MSGERVDLDDLATLAVAALGSARDRRASNAGEDRPAERWIMAPRRDGAVDVVVASSGADVFDRALLVDAAFAVAAQPAVILALIARILEVEHASETAVGLLETCAGRFGAMPEYATTIADARSIIERGVLL